MIRPRSIQFALILIVLTCGGQATAEVAGLMGTAVPGSSTHWTAAEPLPITAASPNTEQPRRVRIGLRLTPYKKIITRHSNGRVESRYIQGQAMRHTLKARLNEPNHFYVGTWHIETAPTNWIKKTGRYALELRLYERYGDYGQLEDHIGNVTLSGTLEEQERNIDVLVGAAKHRFRDSFGNPRVDVVAGYQPGEAMEPISLAKPGVAPY